MCHCCTSCRPQALGGRAVSWLCPGARARWHLPPPARGHCSRPSLHTGASLGQGTELCRGKQLCQLLTWGSGAACAGSLRCGPGRPAQRLAARSGRHHGQHRDSWHCTITPALGVAISPAQLLCQILLPTLMMFQSFSKWGACKPSFFVQNYVPVLAHGPHF